MLWTVYIQQVEYKHSTVFQNAQRSAQRRGIERGRPGRRTAVSSQAVHRECMRVQSSTTEVGAGADAIAAVIHAIADVTRDPRTLPLRRSVDIDPNEHMPGRVVDEEVT